MEVLLADAYDAVWQVMGVGTDADASSKCSLYFSYAHEISIHMQYATTVTVTTMITTAMATIAVITWSATPSDAV